MYNRLEGAMQKQELQMVRVEQLSARERECIQQRNWNRIDPEEMPVLSQSNL